MCSTHRDIWWPARAHQQYRDNLLSICLFRNSYIWDFSTYCNYNSFPEAVKCQVSSMYPISNRCISLALQRVGSESQDRPHDSLGKTTGSFFAPLLTSLSLCGVKIQSCILLSGQTAVVCSISTVMEVSGWERESEQLPPGNPWIQTTKTWWVTSSVFK